MSTKVTTGNITSGSASDGHVLTADGAGGAAFEAPAGGGGAWALVSTQIASGDSSIIDTNINIGTNDVWALVLDSIKPSIDDVIPRFRFGDSIGIDSGASDYAYHTARPTSSGTTYSASSSVASDAVNLGSANGNASGEGMSGVLYIYKGSDGFPRVVGQLGYTNFASEVVTATVGGQRLASITLDRFQFFYSSGNVASGTFRLYKLTNS